MAVAGTTKGRKRKKNVLNCSMDGVALKRESDRCSTVEFSWAGYGYGGGVFFFFFFFFSPSLSSERVVNMKIRKKCGSKSRRFLPNKSTSSQLATRSDSGYSGRDV
jgi:hypothetical protein